MITNDEEDPSRSEPSKFNPWNPIAAILRCWRWALPLGLVFAGITAFIILGSYEPKYRAKHLLGANRDYVAFEGVMPSAENLVQSETALIRNPVILDFVLADPKFRTAPSLADPATAEKKLQKNLSFTSGGTKDHLIVGYEDATPEAAALVCNGIVESYLSKRDAFDNLRISNLEKWLEPEMANWERIVENEQQKVTKLNKKMLGHAPGDLAAKVRLEGKMEFIKNIRSRIDEVSLSLEILDAQLAIGDPKNDSNPKAPESELTQEDAETLKAMERNHEFSSAELAVLKKKLVEENSKLEQFGGATAELQFATGDLEIAQDVLSKIKKRAAEIRTERRQSGAIRSIAAATPPRSSINSPPYKQAVIFSLVVFLVPFMFGYLLGFKPSPAPVASSDETD